MITVGSFPYAPANNPYQLLFTNSLESAGLNVDRIPPEKWFPLQKLATTTCDLFHLDWPHDWYLGRNSLSQLLKRWMYLNGLSKIKSKPVVWTVHNLVAHDSPNADYEKQMIQALINVCSGLMVMSNSSHHQLCEQYDVPESTSVIKVAHGHYIDAYPNQISRSEARRELELEESGRVYLSFGAIRPYKGHEKLIKAFNAVGKSNDNLVIAGNGQREYAEHLKSCYNGELSASNSLRVNFRGKTAGVFQRGRSCRTPV